jgi:hypothetical protein
MPDALRPYAKLIGHFALKPNSEATRARSQAIIQLPDALLVYAKQIGHIALNPNSVAIRARSQAIWHCEMHVSHTPNTLATLFKIQIH